MIANRMKVTPPLAAVTATIMTFAFATSAQAAAPVKLILSSHFGREVNLTEATAKGGPALEDVCTVESKDECQPGKPSSQSGGFDFLGGIAVAPGGNVYVADTVNERVQELTATGAFVSMFGREVNETKDVAVKAKGGAPTPTELEEENVCTAASGNVCKAGVPGTAAGQLDQPESLAVDPSTGNVYVEEYGNSRVQEFTASGEFVLMFGKEVNETKDKASGATPEEKNLCTALSKDKCKAGAQNTQESAEPSAFSFGSGDGSLLAIAGPKDLLYVGDQNRVQEFEADGTWVGEIPLGHVQVTALAVDESGDVYLAYEQGNVIHKLDPSGVEVKNADFPLTLSPRTASVEPLVIRALAIDASGRLAAGQIERHPGGGAVPFGSLFSASTGQLISEFPIGTGSGITFNDKGELYAAVAPSVGGHEVLAYAPKAIAELVARPHTCEAGAEHETDVTDDCALNGSVNPWGVSETAVWFEWGRTPELESETPKQPIGEGEALLPVTPAVLKGLLPDTAVYYRLAAYDLSVKPPEEPLISRPLASFTTPTAPPRVVGEPSASFIRSSSAVLFGELNPENANTEYFFEYGPCGELASCAAKTEPLTSSAYGTIGATQEAVGLQPGTVYHYRLSAKNEAGEPAVGESGGSEIREGTFTTAPAPELQAQTGGASALATTSATVSGTVNPDGEAATYTFELALYNGALTQYGVVFTGSAGASSVPVEETLALSGLEPGVTYAYRIAVQSGYGTARGETATFTTAGLPAALSAPIPLAQLPIPNIAFPQAVTATVKPTTKALTNAQKLAKALAACKKKAKRQRAACKKQARKKYAKSKQANDRKKR
jgi:hypothetical protein